MRPVPVGVDPKLAAFLAEVRSAITQMQNPGQPVQCFATVQGQLPPAAGYPNCEVLVTDKNTKAISTLVSGTWTWLRSDGTAI